MCNATPYWKCMIYPFLSTFTKIYLTETSSIVGHLEWGEIEILVFSAPLMDRSILVLFFLLKVKMGKI
jgi:hypothetical protein